MGCNELPAPVTYGVIFICEDNLQLYDPSMNNNICAIGLSQVINLTHPQSLLADHKKIWIKPKLCLHYLHERIN